MRESDEYLIRGFPIFRGVSDEAFARVTADAAIREVPSGTVLLVEGEKPESLFVLLNGLVETYASHGERTVTLAYIRPPSAFIVAAVWMDQIQLTSARTMAPCRVLVMPAAAVRAELQRPGGFAHAAGLEMAIRYRDVMRELKNQRLRAAPERLANWLLIESAVAGAPVFDLPIGKAALAARLGITGEHLSRAFAQLREQGVRIAGPRVEIDRERLALFAQPSESMDG